MAPFSHLHCFHSQFLLLRHCRRHQVDCFLPNLSGCFKFHKLPRWAKPLLPFAVVSSSTHLTFSDSKIPASCYPSLGEKPPRRRMQTIKRISTSFGRPVSPPANEIRARLEEFGEDVHCVKNSEGVWRSVPKLHCCGISHKQTESHRWLVKSGNVRNGAGRRISELIRKWLEMQDVVVGEQTGVFQLLFNCFILPFLNLFPSRRGDKPFMTHWSRRPRFLRLVLLINARVFGHSNLPHDNNNNDEKMEPNELAACNGLSIDCCRFCQWDATKGNGASDTNCQDVFTPSTSSCSSSWATKTKHLAINSDMWCFCFLPFLEFSFFFQIMDE